MDSKIQDIIAFVQRTDIDVVGITVSVDVQKYLLEKSMLEEDTKYRITKFAGNTVTVGMQMPVNSMRVVYNLNGITTQKMFYNIRDMTI